MKILIYYVYLYMQNTRKKKSNKKNRTKKCMDTYANKRIILWTSGLTKEIKKLENKKNLTKEEKILLKNVKKQRKSQRNNLKKQYKLTNCNINCKNTLMEPGPPNQIPNYVKKKTFGNSKLLIKIFTKRRKDLFKNKTNVLIDNFYENVPEETKKKLIKEGAISDCTLPINFKGGSIIFEDGRMKKTEETFDGKPFFRKVFYYDETSTDMEQKIRLAQAAKAEIAIVNILIQNPFPNIATYYKVNNKYVEMEELDTRTKLNPEKLIETMKKVKDFLQSLGIMYIDWKSDNIGLGKDGEYKLFDFDASGIIDLKTNDWIVKPVEYWNYRKAIENGCKTPQQIDDYSFNYGILGIKNKK